MIIGMPRARRVTLACDEINLNGLSIASAAVMYDVTEEQIIARIDYYNSDEGLDAQQKASESNI